MRFDRRTAGGEQQDRELGDATGEVGEEAQRCAVDPVQIVDRDQQWRLGREVRRQPVQAVQRGGGRVVTDVPLARQPEHRPGECRRSLQPAPALLAGGPADASLQQLTHHAVGEVALQLATAGGQDLQSGCVGETHPRLQQTGLADAGRPLEDHRRAATAGRISGQLPEAIELVVALEELGAAATGPDTARA